MTSGMSPGPTDEELLEVLAPALELPITSFARREFEYATSHPLEELRIGLSDGRTIEVILKDLAWERLLPDARRSEPRTFFDPRRCVEIQRVLLDPWAVGPRCYAAVADATIGRYWLLLEKVPGVPLWQVGELERWVEVARWLAAFHSMSSSEDVLELALPARLVRYDRQVFVATADRALAALRHLPEDRGGLLLALMDGYEEVVVGLETDAPRFVHGEFFASNILVVPSTAPMRVCPIDWEMAGVGPPLLDLAALTAGWDGGSRSRMVAAYAGSLAPTLDPRQLTQSLLRCRMHLALQWIGWADDWTPPDAHARDWIGEAMDVGKGLGL